MALVTTLACIERCVRNMRFIMELPMTLDSNQMSNLTFKLKAVQILKRELNLMIRNNLLTSKTSI